MPLQMHAISGLPRSGSTLLATLLRQNPRFHASVTTPVYMLTSSLLEQTSPGKEFSSFFDDNRRKTLIRALVDGYYSDVPSDKIVFDTNRVWSAKLSLLKSAYPHSRVICCVREIGWIIDSIERMLKRNPLQTSRIFGFKPGGSIYSRVQTLMGTDNGLIGLAWSSLHEAWFSEDASRLIVVQYDSLVSEPQTVLARLYQELNETPFNHVFDNLSYGEPVYDAELGMPGMHEVKPTVEAEQREISIPPDLFKKHADLSFWSKAGNNPRRVLVL